MSEFLNIIELDRELLQKFYGKWNWNRLVRKVCLWRCSAIIIPRHSLFPDIHQIGLSVLSGVDEMRMDNCNVTWIGTVGHTDYLAIKQFARPVDDDALQF